MADTPEDNNDYGFRPPSLSIDWELYAHHLDQSDLTDEEKQAFIESIWTIIVSFVDMGFGIHPFQQATEKCSGQVDDIRASDAKNMISSPQGLPKKQTDNAVDCHCGNSAGKEES